MRLLFSALIFAAAMAPAATGVLGDWQTPTHSIVRIYACGPNICARIVQLSASAPESTDRKNPDPSLRGRSLCGLDVGVGFHQIDADHLDGGYLYDPQTGRSYRGTITSTGDQMQLRGYIGIPLFGRSETWHRASTLAAACR